MKNNIKKMKKQVTKWEKLFTKHISNTELISKIYKNTYNSIIDIFKMSKRFELKIFKRRYMNSQHILKELNITCHWGNYNYNELLLYSQALF